MNLENIKKNSNNFSFTEVVADLATNKEFTKGYNELVNNTINENSYIWYALSAIGQDVSNTIYENILNYIDNIANIDKCNIKALRSISKVLGVEHHGILENLDNFPEEILDLVDIFSVNKKYLENINFSSIDLYTDLYISSLPYINKTSEKLSGKISNIISSDIKNNFELEIGFDNTVYNTYVENAFYTLLSNNVCAKYIKDLNFSNSNYIINNLSSYIMQLESGEIQEVNQDLNLPYRENIEKLRSNLNLPLSFNPYLIADNINDGLDFLDNYHGNERYLILAVLNYRDKEKYNRETNSYENNSLTKFAYYKEKKFIKYLKFINLYNSFINESTNSYLKNFETYELDKNYAQIISSSANLKKLTDQVIEHISKNENSNNKIEIISNVAKSLKEICFIIVDIREKLKTQCQRNYMRGTFLLISYIINEYLKNNVKKQYTSLSSNIDEMTRDDIGIIEYDDLTEYFNIKTETSEDAYNANMVNARFWESESNISEGMIGLAIDAIDNFYLNKMNLKTSVSATRDFLDIIYELGATKTYIDGRADSPETDSVIISEVIDEVKEKDINDSRVKERYDAISAYQYNMFLKYSGTEIGWNPYFNWKNETHSSYQVHPYLYNFVEYNNSLINTVKNAFYNDANETLISVLLTPEISTHIGEVGNILNIWKDDIIDYSGYRSRYEINNQSKDNDYIDITNYYDGIFYPEAVTEFVLSAQNENKFEELLFCIKNRYTGQDIFNALSNSNNLVFNNFLKVHDNQQTFFSEFIIYLYEYKNKEAILNKELEFGDSSSSYVKELIIDFNNFKKQTPKTFYDKWYHFTNLLTRDAEKLANNLSVYKDDILDLVSGDYDIYKYTLDKFGNSIALYKKYEGDVDFETKQDTPGRIWFKKAGQPIGFPFTKREDTLSKDIINFTDDLITTNEFFDIEQTSDYEHLLLVSKENGDPIITIVKPTTEDIIDTNHKGEFIKKYNWTKFNYNTDSIIKNPTDYKFGGIFQYGNGDVVISFFKTDFENSNNNKYIVSIKDFLFPEEDFVKENSYDIEYFTTISAMEDTPCKLSFLNGKYAIVWLANIESKPFVGSNYIGVNSNIKENDSSDIEILDSNYGEFDDISSYVLEEEGEVNSFEIFNTYVAMLEFDTSYNTPTTLKYYNLNSDASYIPLYSGINGFIRIWASKYYADQEIKSIELLGSSYNKLLSSASNFENNMYEDEDGKFTADDPTNFVSTISRIYENYNISSTYMTYYNNFMKLEDGVYTWSQTLMSSINETNLSDYHCFLYNINSSVTVPIFKGKLSDDKIKTTYISAMTKGDEYYYNNHTISKFTTEVAGTPDIFGYSVNENGESILEESYLETNSIFGVEDVSVNYDVISNMLNITFTPINPDRNYIIEGHTLLLIIYKEDLGQYSDYHYMTHHNIWPYSGEYSSDNLLSVDLSNYTSFDDPAISGMFTTGNIVFKINEESDATYLKYPNRAIDDTLNDIFESTQSTYLQLSNIFSTNNTYVLELEKPKTIADMIGEVEMDIFSGTEQCMRVTEEYLSAIHNISRFDETEISGYLMGFYDDNGDGFIKCTDTTNKPIPERKIKYTVTESDVKDFLKLYVNFAKDEDGQIILFFNYNNLFLSPYLYQRNNGKFYVEFKPETFKKIAPNESTNLDIVIQIKYFNQIGEVCGVKDIPVLSYKIYNVSDDKPKFIIKNTWIINEENALYVREVSMNKDNSAYLIINDSNINLGNDLSRVLLDNYTTANDIIAYCDVTICSDETGTNVMKISSAVCDIIYNFADKSIEFLEEKSSGGFFAERNGLIHVTTVNSKFRLAFRLKSGTFIDDETAIRYIPLDAINFSAYDIMGNRIVNTYVKYGNISISFRYNGNIVNNYLGKEDNSGFIETEDNKLITIFRNKLFNLSEIQD